jgi:hypothetical protein
MLVGLTTLDASTYVAVAAAFAAVAMLAVYLPARRAAARMSGSARIFEAVIAGGY